MWLFCAILMYVNILIFVVLVSAHGHGVLGVTDDLKSLDVASIALLAATLAVIGVGVAVALITFIGYNDIKASAINAARDAALKLVKEVAPSVAARTALETQPTQTTEEDAARIAQAENGPS
jgi:UDP-N-acetylmuramyl pentapeptide phosphotransferase/UDP-N-acetylglucosamine-1-phosphate transferase